MGYLSFLALPSLLREPNGSGARGGEDPLKVGSGRIGSARSRRGGLGNLGAAASTGAAGRSRRYEGKAVSTADTPIRTRSAQVPACDAEVSHRTDTTRKR
jgi:hypothetical protein